MTFALRAPAAGADGSVESFEFDEALDFGTSAGVDTTAAVDESASVPFALAVCPVKEN